MIQRGYVDTPEGQIHYRRAGSGPVTVLLLHQTAASSAMYEAFMTALIAERGEDAFTLIALDTPGFGQSYRPAEQYSLEAWSDAVASAVTGLGVAGFHVVGHHTGASIGILLAAREPRRVQSLTMIGAVAMSAAEAAARHGAVRGLVLDDSGRHLIEVWEAVNSIDGDPEAHPPSIELREREAVDKLTAGTRWHEAYLAVFGTDLVSPLSRVGCPILLLCGRADVLFPYVATTRDANPGMTVVELDAGAYVLDQDPGLVVAPFLDFIPVAVA
jgi:pimeloyl-ACP methyl ester carboxylesterase